MSENIKRYTLIQEELNEYLNEKNEGMGNQIINSFFRLLKGKQTLRYSFLVPSSYYLRAELLCEDISFESGSIYTQANLIHLLFSDFLANVRILADHHQIYSELVARDNRPPIIRINGEEQKHIPPTKLKDFVEAECIINRRSALRMEVFLADLNELYPDNPISVEDVLQIMYCDFIRAYKSGEMKNIVTRISKHHERDN